MDHPKDQPLCLVLDFQGIDNIWGKQTETCSNPLPGMNYIFPVILWIPELYKDPCLMVKNSLSGPSSSGVMLNGHE